MLRAMNTRWLYGLLLVGVFLLGSVYQNDAAAYDYGAFEGDTVNYISVADTTETEGDPDGLFGGDALAPRIVGNKLFFFPNYYISQVSGDGLDNTYGLLSIEVEAKEGSYITELNIRERGDYAFSGTGGADTNASAFASLFFTGFNDAGDDFVGDDDTRVDFYMGQDPDSGRWQLDVSVFFDPADQITSAVIQFDNNLGTESESSSSSYIQKKVIGGPAIVVAVNETPVPVPGAVWLLISGLAACVWGKRKKK
ncbi:MAG: hypothetical protein CR984_04590 [Proteobacteria bacterium]|nr:MAG: hypothetical protein CR984_04590 [Pseudomonadota bacterium]